MNVERLQPVYDSLLQHLRGIEVLVEHKLLLPSLVLIYSGIDAAAALAAPDSMIKVGNRFTSWVDRYLLAAQPMRARAIDLYAARCGVVHTLTADASLIDRGLAIHVSYAWGNADPALLQHAIDQTIPGATVAIHVKELADGFRGGLARMFEEAGSDDALAQRIQTRASRFFAPLPADLGNQERPASPPV